MYYKEYVKAAYRHLSTCMNLLDDIENAQKSQADKNHWLCEVYYLSGYVVECMLSYVLFYQYNYHVEKNQYYCSNFLTHNLPSKVHHVVNVAKRQLHGVPLISCSHEKKSINSLFANWSVDFRYESMKSINVDDIKQYIHTIEEIRNLILNKYPLT